MRRINLYIEETTFKAIKKLQGTLSFHFRIALRDYLEKIQTTNVASSQSKRKEEDKNE